jgi:hypothetical protein
MPEMPLDKWARHSTTGFFLGVTATYTVAQGGFYLVIPITPSIISYQMSGYLVLVGVGGGLSIGFAILGWRQAQALHPYVRGAWWWIGAMALAWVPVPLVWLGYEGLVGSMAINIYPEPHDVVKTLAAEVALLCPSLAMFVVIARRTRIGTETGLSTDRTGADLIATWHNPRRLRGIVVGMLVPVLTVTVAFGALVVGHNLRVERVWMASGPADYLAFTSDGQVETSPPANDIQNAVSKLSDASPDGSLRASVEGTHVVLSTTIGAGGARTIRTLEVFSGPPPEYYYAEDIINVVRFSPDGTLLAAGTGQAFDYDSAVNRSNDHAVHIWSVRDGVERYTLTGPHYSVHDVAWSPDGRYLAAAGGLENGSGMVDGDNLVRIWRLEPQGSVFPTSPTLILTLPGHTRSVEALAWNPDGSRLVSRDLSGRVVIWRML